MSSYIMWKSILFKCISSYVIVYCCGKPVKDLAITSNIQLEENNLNIKHSTAEKLCNNFDESELRELKEANHNEGLYFRNLNVVDMSTTEPTQILFTKSFLSDRIQESSLKPSATDVRTSSKSPLEYNPHRPSFAGQLSGGQLGQLIPPGKPWPADPPIAQPSLEDRLQETTLKPASTSSKSPLEYNAHRPSFAGQLSGGQLGQLITPGKPWPADPPIAQPSLEDRLQETTLKPASTSSKSPLEYNSHRPSFAGQLSGGQLGQLIPPGKPWPADPPIAQPSLEDRLQETTLKPASTSSKSPLEYNSHRPSFAGQLSGGQLGQLIPPGKPWPADPPIAQPSLEDRLQETTLKPASTSSKSPLEYNAHRPSFAGELSGGQLGQLITPGKPWPADPAIAQPSLEDRLQETTLKPASTSSKSPLEYNAHRPSFAGELSGGQLGQLITPGKPWPADPPVAQPSLEDRLQETTLKPASTSSKSPLEYNSHRPSFAGELSGGQLGQLITPGKPWPADPPIAQPSLEDRLQETTLKPASTSSKSPLEYNAHRPSFAGQLSGGQLGQLITPGKPWPADPPIAQPSLEDRLQETTLKPASTSSKSPLEYNAHRPSFAEQLSGGQLGQLIPPGKPWPADPPIAQPSLEDRLQETTLKPASSSNKSLLKSTDLF